MADWIRQGVVADQLEGGAQPQAGNWLKGDRVQLDDRGELNRSQVEATKRGALAPET